MEAFIGSKYPTPDYFTNLYTESFHEADADKDGKLNADEYKNYR